ncbi:sugar-specific transcriptional regulator TrmB [Halonotius aquaticus]|uniref:Sugar-specific transcriptional regulator TrmB n=1 Tax=Halonotius aquaticus TaxID=2216978 RepID=A0A3A6PVE0_9EURY|nr:helix-turn-helix domain-containing protein [Halonotius aquaticus]RJX42311.1 sugar-specific transcriptional regulator TrmB [Halonotius aquaticus]
MDEFDPAPAIDDTTEPRQQWLDDTDTFGRVYDVVLGITTPAPAAEIAEIADCSPNAATKHLSRLAEMGVVNADRESRPARYSRNDGYLEWQEASRIGRDLSVAEIIDRVESLEAERDEYEERFGTTDPAEVSVFDYDDHDTIHERMAAVSEWQGLIRDLRLYELARQLAQNDGHLIPA